MVNSDQLNDIKYDNSLHESYLHYNLETLSSMWGTQETECP